MSVAHNLNQTIELKSPIGLIAGNGSYPLEFVKNAKAKGLEVFVVAHAGETDPQVADFASQCMWIKVGELGRIINFLKQHKVQQVALAGGISRIKMFGGVKLDLRAMALIARIRSVQDDKILRGIAEELEGEGLSVISASVLLAGCLAQAGYMTTRKLSADELSDAQVGWRAAKGLGALDIGQTVVVSKGLVVAVEAVEGTDKVIERGGQLAGSGTVVVKLSKPQQDLRLDLPTIGPGTIEALIKVKAGALVLETEKCIILDKEAVIKAANRSSLAILVAGSEAELA